MRAVLKNKEDDDQRSMICMIEWLFFEARFLGASSSGSVTESYSGIKRGRKGERERIQQTRDILLLKYKKGKRGGIERESLSGFG